MSAVEGTTLDLVQALRKLAEGIVVEIAAILALPIFFRKFLRDRKAFSIACSGLNLLSIIS
ncbi:MAG: hypothetical protein DHS20C17_27580 [Cyclobacteriaceae bacterium]|nr:MAG: hypothetical protein DHS20C17_27580 [Cyclobacteriaceae bacterium]